jgi:transcriptional regulator with XRE-family HTH domain
MTNYGEKIKKLRKEKGLTLKELGEVIDFNYSNLSKIERNERKPTIELLEKLAEFFEVEISYFFGEKQEIPEEFKDLGIEWISFSKEMSEKEISLEELRTLAETIAKLKHK